MSIFNRRNALFGWLAWLFAKRALKRKARGAMPTGDAPQKGRSAGLAAATAAIVGGLLFWRRRRGAAERGPADESPE